MSLLPGLPASPPSRIAIAFTTPLPSRHSRTRLPSAVITSSLGQKGLVTCVVAEKQSAMAHRPPTTSAPIARRTINLVPTCAPICTFHYLSMSLISPQRSLSPKRSTKSVRTPSSFCWFIAYTYLYSSYVSGLEDRLEKMEALLKRVRIIRVRQHHALLNPNAPSPSCARRSISLNTSAHPSSGIPGSLIHSHPPRLQDRLARKTISQPV